MDVVKIVGEYLNTPVGTLCYNSDKVLTTMIDKENIEGFTSIILRLAQKSGSTMSYEQTLLSYQWLEHLSMFAEPALNNHSFAKHFMHGIDVGLEKSSYLTGHHFNITDVAAYHILYPLIKKLTVLELESIMNVCRWFKNVQSQPRVCGNREPLPLNTLTLTLLAPAAL